MDVEQLANFVADFAGGFPREIGKQLEDVEIIVCPDVKTAHEELSEIIEVAPGDRIEEVPDDCKGVFIGEPMEVEDGDGEDEHETVTLPNGAIALIASNIKDPEEATLVLLHEIGHALGMDEEEVKALGLGVQSSSTGSTPNGSSSQSNSA